MTTYTAIPDASLEPGKPARSVDALLLRDNPIAIAEGAAGAPGIGGAAANILNGEIGSVVLAYRTNTVDKDFGDTVAGSELKPAGMIYSATGTYPNSSGTSVVQTSASSTALSGTWRCLGVSPYIDATNMHQITLWLRIS